MSLKQRKIKFKPRIKLNHNTYITLMMMFAISDNKQKNLKRSCSKQSENAQKTWMSEFIRGTNHKNEILDILDVLVLRSSSTSVEWAEHLYKISLFSCSNFQGLHIFQDCLYLLRRECGVVFNTNFYQFYETFSLHDSPKQKKDHTHTHNSGICCH